jgi:hypothetical protein
MVSASVRRCEAVTSENPGRPSAAVLTSPPGHPENPARFFIPATTPSPPRRGPGSRPRSRERGAATVATMRSETNPAAGGCAPGFAKACAASKGRPTAWRTFPGADSRRFGGPIFCRKDAGGFFRKFNREPATNALTGFWSDPIGSGCRGKPPHPVVVSNASITSDNFGSPRAFST